MVNGGIITKVTKFPRRAQQGELYAVQGVWTGGSWTPKIKLEVQQYNDIKWLNTWTVAGVDLINRSVADVVLILQASDPTATLAPNDILVFDTGEFSVFEIQNTNLPIHETVCVQVGVQRQKALVKMGEKAIYLILFHELGVIPILQEPESVWFHNQRYTISLATPTHLNGATVAALTPVAVR